MRSNSGGKVGSANACVHSTPASRLSTVSKPAGLASTMEAWFTDSNWTIHESDESHMSESSRDMYAESSTAAGGMGDFSMQAATAALAARPMPSLPETSEPLAKPERKSTASEAALSWQHLQQELAVRFACGPVHGVVHNVAYLCTAGALHLLFFGAFKCRARPCTDVQGISCRQHLVHILSNKLCHTH